MKQTTIRGTLDEQGPLARNRRTPPLELVAAHGRPVKRAYRQPRRGLFRAFVDWMRGK